VKVGIVSLGCAKNRVDAEWMLGRLKSAGHEIVEDYEQADAVIVNTCGFIDAAKEESLDAIFEAAQLKAGKLKSLIVSGCLSQRYGKELQEQLPEVDAVLGIGQGEHIVSVLEQTLRGSKPGFTPGYFSFPDPDVKRMVTTGSHSVYLKVADGCDNRCAYCVIPLIRGPMVSRPIEEVLAEARTLYGDGTKEVNVIAQDTTRYGLDLYGEHSLPRLLEGLSDVGFDWIRVLYAYPDVIDQKLVDVMTARDNIVKYVDMPIQHVNDRLLTRMNRHGGRAAIDNAMRLFRNAGGFALRTTVICGFPGETQAMHDELVRFVKEHPFERLGAFAYSPQEDTPAIDFPDQVDEETKQAWVEEVMLAQQEVSLAFNEGRVGTVAEVLIEEERAQGYAARSAWEAPEIDGEILVRTDGSYRTGDKVRVRITQADVYDCEAEVCT
jgi:ribosomal protein S12 methylthiotransferase